MDAGSLVFLVPISTIIMGVWSGSRATRRRPGGRAAWPSLRLDSPSVGSEDLAELVRPHICDRYTIPVAVVWSGDPPDVGVGRAGIGARINGR